VLVISRKTLIPLALAAAVTITGAYRPAFAQAAQGAAQGAQKNWKDRAEYDLYESITKETTPAKRLELLNSWKEKYPSSEFADVRQQVFMATYAQMGRPADALSTAGEILAKDPNNLQALSAALTAIFSVQNPTPDQLSTAEKAASQVSSNLDTLFAADKKPANVSDADWTTAKKNLQILAQNTLGYTAWQRKDLEKAETEFTKSLQLDPNQGQVSYWLSNVILAERKPEKYSTALYHFARAASYDGPGSLNAQGRQQVLGAFQKTYNQYHGSAEGADKVLAAAKAAALPAADFKIPSKADIAREGLQKEEELKKANPSLALWKSIKTELTGGNAQAYFDSSMKDTAIPMEFKGKLIEARPETNPKELVLSVEDGLTPDATLVLDAPLRGKMENGTEIGFKDAVATSYTPSPYMVTFKADKANITGWKGAPAAPAAKPRPRSGARKK
jgi:tetratricopeptide (TPR) repeat protein